MCDRKPRKPFIRSHKARSEWVHHRSTGSIRDDFRNTFFNRLRSNRSRSVDRFRQIVEDYGELLTYRSVTDLRKVLEADHEASNLMRQVEVNEVLNQIEHELAQVGLEDQGEQHETETKRETDEILQRLYYVCQICHTENVESAEDGVCINCSQAITNEFAK